MRDNGKIVSLNADEILEVSGGTDDLGLPIDGLFDEWPWWWPRPGPGPRPIQK